MSYPVAALVGEFLGAFLLMLSVLVSAGNALVIGLTLAFIVFLIGPISGAAVNPAIAFGSFFQGTLSLLDSCLYIAVEYGGALAAVYAFKAVA